jgi:aspartyl-tRNA(Asn)/glutamyl-tRNA(Gln) amidotransferase subunit C
MSVDADTVRRIAQLARIGVAEDEIEHLRRELNAILAFVEQLSQVDVEGVEPMTSVIPMEMKKRPDMVTDGGIPDDIIANAPAAEDHFFVVPKVVE